MRDAHPAEGEDEERVRPALRPGDLVVLGRDADDLADRRLVGARQRPEHHRIAADRADAVVVEVLVGHEQRSALTPSIAG